MYVKYVYISMYIYKYLYNLHNFFMVNYSEIN